MGQAIIQERLNYSQTNHTNQSPIAISSPIAVSKLHFHEIKSIHALCSMHHAYTPHREVLM
uniref:Uncharacterized protein n=1 Tax=Arundo donax TaxID=35708 RepID=A0A0A9E2E3_ARUDO